MNQAAGKPGFVRRYDYKRHHLTIGYTLFYSAVLALVTLLVCKAAAGHFSVLPSFLGASPFGVLYFYNILVYVTLSVGLILCPLMLMFDGLPTNRWNLYYKNGIAPAKLIFNKLLFCVGSLLRVYALGALLAFVVGFLTRGTTGTGVGDLVRVFLLGAAIVLLLVMPALFFAVFLYNRFLVSLFVALSSVGVFFLLHAYHYFSAPDETAAIAAVRALGGFSPTGAVVPAVALLLIFSGGMFLFAVPRVRSYNTEELDDEALIQLGISKNVMVYEKDGSDYEVAISGPEVNGLADEPELPDFADEEAPAPRKAKKAARKQRVKDEEDEEED